MSRRRSPLPRGWSAIRRGVLERDRWQCQIKGQRCTGRAGEVDHVGDRDNHSGTNLRAACTRCHAQRTAQQARAAQLSERRPEQPHPAYTWEGTPSPGTPGRPAQAFASPYGTGDSDEGGA